ncbi:MAG: DUF2905 domain-containing protein [candidate division Zixibacteria bacterium]|nr:DUF2905 domain-containing protein [candidate division Zixibacteria bacterium]
MPEFGKIFIIIGIIFIAVGGFLLLGGKLGLLGQLPGDFVIRKKNFTFFFPLATSLLLSVGLTIIFYLIRFFKK